MTNVSTIRRAVWALAITLPCILPLAGAADIQGSADHPMVSRFPDTSIIAYGAADYSASYFPSSPSNSKGFQEGQWVYGDKTWIVYQAPANRSTLEIFRNYEAALGRAGFESLFTCQKGECGARFIHHMVGTGGTVGGYESWMPNTGRYLAARLPATDGDIWVSLLVHENDKKAARIRLSIIEEGPPRTVGLSQPLDEAFPGIRQLATKKRDYDEARLASSVVKDNKLDTLHLEGEVNWTAYRFPSRVAPIEVVHSYRQALETAGWENLLYCSNCGANFTRKVVGLNGNIIGNNERWAQWSDYYVLGKHVDSGGTTHLSILSYRHPDGYTVGRFLSVKSKILALDLVKVSAEALADDLDKSGRVAVYGIYFDSDRAELKPESDATVQEIARLLEMRPALSLFVDGHTDDRGSEDYNLDLSQRRASAVVEALVERHGVSTDRLEARGYGENAPLDSNETEDGRARNRRVELVAKEVGG